MEKLMFLEKDWNMVVRDYLLSADPIAKAALMGRLKRLEEHIGKEEKLHPSIVSIVYGQKFARFCQMFAQNNACQSFQQGSKRKKE